MRSRSASNRMKKNIISIIAVIAVFGGLVWLARPNGQNTPPISARANGALAVEGQSKYDFGVISMAAGKVTQVFRVKNTGTEPVTVNKMYTSCMCTTAVLMVGNKKIGPYGMPGHGFIPNINQAIAPEEVAEVEVVFDPAAHGPAGIGRIERVVVIENNAGDQLELQIAATVKP